MTRKLITLLLLATTVHSNAQKLACTSDPAYRQFDFWIGQREVYAKNGKKAGESKIELILDSCIILENWTSASARNGIYFSGKSFNTYNAATKQWQQTWVDNMGGTTEFLQGHYEDHTMTFLSRPFPFHGDTVAIRRLTFYNLEPNRVRQHGEISKDNGKTWVTEYDLDYHRKDLNNSKK